MSAYLIYWNGRGPVGADAYRFPSKHEATIYIHEGMPGDYRCFAVEDENDFQALDKVTGKPIFTTGTLLTVYNALTGESVAKFADAKVGRKRILRALEKVAKEPPPVEATKRQEKKMAQEAEVEAKVKAPRAERAPRSSKVDDRTITLLVTENPKRRGSKSYDRYELYRTHRTVGAFLAAGGSAADLKWDAAHEFIRVGGAAKFQEEYEIEIDPEVEQAA